MPGLARNQLLGYLAAGAVVVVLGALWARGGGTGRGSAGAVAAPRASLQVSDAGASGTLVIHVAGAVRRPGVYRLGAGARVAAAVRRAGGATRRADLDALNLAAKLTDGRQVLVPERAPTAGGGAASAAGSTGSAAVPGPPLNLNSATADQLATLDGIGPAMAAKIIAYRQAQGGFGSVDELDQVPGIGPKRLAALRDRVTA